jgi:hypothetical protein
MSERKSETPEEIAAKVRDLFVKLGEEMVETAMENVRLRAEVAVLRRDMSDGWDAGYAEGVRRAKGGEL